MRLFKPFFIAAILLVASCKTAKYADLDKGLYADIETDKGDILCQLYFEDTPLTVANFMSLAEGENPKVSEEFKGKKYYDGLTFHRVMKDFMIQGGDPLANGTGGPGFLIEDEFPKDSLGRLKYMHDGAGVLSMANSGPPGTNGSQFFITHKETPWLNGKHTVFGKVRYGQGVVDSIEQGDTIKHVRFIKIGSKAKKFDAAKVFPEEFDKSLVAKQKRIDAKKEQDKLRYEKFLKDKEAFHKAQGIAKATKSDSGMSTLVFKKGKGKKMDAKVPTSIHYTISLADGTQIQSTKGRTPFSFTLSVQPMIAGVQEAILKMREGGSVRLFIPYYLAYGENGGGPFPPKADIVFDLELVKVGK